MYLYLIPNNPSQTFDIFHKIRFFFFHNGGNKADFIKWWKLSPTYDADKTQLKIFESIPDSKTNNMNFLKKCALKSQPDYFNTQSPLLDAYYNPIYDIKMDTINETCSFVSQAGTDFENDIFSKHSFIALNADMGCGKSVAIKRLIPLYKRVLILTPRITYCKHAVREFNVESYLDGVYVGDKIACSIESLHKLPIDSVYDLIIMDECEAILSIFSSPTLNGRELTTFNTLSRIIQQSCKVIFAGAFITQKTVDYIKSFEDKTFLLINHTKTVPRKQAIQIDGFFFNTKLIDYLESGGKPYVFFDSKTQADKLISFLAGKAHNNEKFTKIYKNLIYYSSGGNDADIDGLDDINDTWDKASFVIATPSITVGNSYCPEQTTFSSVWINFYPSCIVADTMQGHKRVRHTTTNKLFFCLPTDKLLKLASSGRGEIIKTMAEFDKITTDKRIIAGTHAVEQRDRITKKLIEDANKQVKWCCNHADSPAKYNLIVDSVSVNYCITPVALRRLLFNNIHESVLSCLYFKSMVRTFIFRCGYDGEKSSQENGAKTNIDRDVKNNNELENNAIEDDVAYDDVITIDEATYNDFLTIIKTKKASPVHKMAVEKYVFDKYIDQNIPESSKHIYFTMWNDKFERTTLNHLFREANNTSNDEFFNAFSNKKTSYETLNPSHTIKLNKLRELLSMLGMQNSLDNTSISTEKMEITGKYIANNRASLHNIFNLKDRCEKKTYTTAYLGYSFLQKVFKSWNNSTFQQHKNKEGKTYSLLSRYYEFPPYVFNLTTTEQSLNEPIPMSGVNESVLNAFNESKNYKVQSITPEPKLVPMNSVLYYTDSFNSIINKPTKTDFHHMCHIKQGINRRFNGNKFYFSLRPDLVKIQYALLCC